MNDLISVSYFIHACLILLWLKGFSSMTNPRRSTNVNNTHTTTFVSLTTAKFKTENHRSERSLCITGIAIQPNTSIKVYPPPFLHPLSLLLLQKFTVMNIDGKFSISLHFSFWFLWLFVTHFIRLTFVNTQKATVLPLSHVCMYVCAGVCVSVCVTPH